MFHTILESGDKTNDIGDEFKTIRSSQIITWGFLAVLFNFETENTFWIHKAMIKYDITVTKCRKLQMVCYKQLLLEFFGVLSLSCFFQSKTWTHWSKKAKFQKVELVLNKLFSLIPNGSCIVYLYYASTKCLNLLKTYRVKKLLIFIENNIFPGSTKEY